MVMDTYSEGYAVGYSGEPENNPYPGGMEAECWSDGYEDGKEDSEIEERRRAARTQDASGPAGTEL